MSDEEEADAVSAVNWLERCVIYIYMYIFIICMQYNFKIVILCIYKYMYFSTQAKQSYLSRHNETIALGGKKVYRRYYSCKARIRRYTKKATAKCVNEYC